MDPEDARIVAATFRLRCLLIIGLTFGVFMRRLKYAATGILENFTHLWGEG